MLLCAFAAIALAARADTVYLNNGNTLEGIVTRETRDEVELDIGAGTTTLPRSSIRRIRRSGKKQRRALRAKQERDFFDSGRWVPDADRPIFERYDELRQAREKALDAKSRRRSLLEEEAGLQSDFDGLQGAERYRAYRRLKEIEALLPLADKQLQGYFTGYRRLAAEIAALAAPAPGEETEFRRRLDEAMAAMADDFEQDAVASRGSAGHVIVQATIDGDVPAAFVVDTGASVTTISPELAARLTPLPGSETKGRSTVADGRSLDVRAFRVASIEVGRSRLERVMVAVMPAPADGVDGLLGMSFLSAFSVEVDPSAGTLRLGRLKDEPPYR